MKKHEIEIQKNTTIPLDDCTDNTGVQWHEVSKTLTRIMNRFSFVFYISLKHVENETTIEEMIISQLLEGKHTTEFEEVILNETDKCLYIVDLLDEWIIYRDGQDCAGVPKRTNKCPTLFTTRPWKMTERGCNSTCLNAEIVMTGIDHNLADWMAENVIKSTEPLKSTLNEKPDFNAFCSSCPMLWRCAVSVWVHEGKQHIPKSFTDLYTSIID